MNVRVKILCTMKSKIILFVVAFLIAVCRCQDGAECQIEDLDGRIDFSGQIIQVDVIKDVEPLNLTFRYALPDLEVEPNDSESGAKYINITADGSFLRIETNDNYLQNFENDQRDTPASTLTIVRTMILVCQGNSYQLSLTVYVQDTNNNAPQFLQDTYSYTMPMPLVPNIDLTYFGDIQIIVEDIDFSQREVIFTIDPVDKFEVTCKVLENKQYQAVLKVTNYVRYDEGLQLTITASDTDHTQQATIIITKDTNYSLPDSPAFSELIYSFTYHSEGSTLTLIPDDPSKEIIVNTSNPADTKVFLSDETYFKSVYDTSTNKVIIVSTGTPIESTSQCVMTLTLTATLGSESSDSAILIKLPI